MTKRLALRKRQVELPQNAQIKQRIEVTPVGPITANETGVPVKAVVVDTKLGKVNFVDKLKGYYHTVITVIAAILVLLNEITPLTNSLGPEVQHWISAAIVFLGAVVNALKSNETWVNAL